MSCICSAALARAPGAPGVLTAIGADSAPGAHRGSGRLAAARNATPAIAAKRTMASVMVGVIEFFITRFLSYGLRSIVGSVFHLADREPYSRLNDAVCVCAGEVRAPGDPAQAGPDLVMNVAELIWEPIAG